MKGTERQPRILFLSMPFVPIKWPSLGLSSLKASLSREGIASEIDYLGFDAAEYFGVSFFNFVAEDTYSSLLGEWIFSDVLFGEAWSDSPEYIEKILKKNLQEKSGVVESSAEIIQQALVAKANARTFIDNCFRSRDWSDYAIIGFTTTFQQNVASLSLAKRIKESNPNVKIVFGGANCEGAMGVGLIKQFDFIDFVFSGESEAILPGVACDILNGQNPKLTKGLISKDPETGSIAMECASNQWVTPIDDMDQLPIPDYSDYFHKQRKFIHVLPRSDVNMSFETSRGCWWGHKNHCTFCGLNPNSMSFRAKSPERALRELLLLQDTYPCDFWQVTDDIIALPYFKTFLPALAEENVGVRLFYETKANLTKEQLRILKSANVTHIQPGIESLSENVLQRMYKGISPIQNVRLLKWCQEIGLTSPWNLIWGFPGEKADDYLEQIGLVDLITHLEPPSYFGSIRLDRFSPHYERAGEYGFKNIRPSHQHKYVYDLSPDALEMIAYTFDFDPINPELDLDCVDDLRCALRQWQTAWHRSDLILLDKNNVKRVIDTRPGYGVKITAVDDMDHALLTLLDPITSKANLLKNLGCSAGDLDTRLENFARNGWIIENRSQMMSVVVISNSIKPGTMEYLRSLQ